MKTKKYTEDYKKGYSAGRMSALRGRGTDIPLKLSDGTVLSNLPLGESRCFVARAPKIITRAELERIVAWLPLQLCIEKEAGDER